MAKKEQLREEIKYLTETLKALWLTIVALIGGTAGLILAELGLRKIAIVLGAGVAVGLLVAVRRIDRKIRSRIRELEEV